VPSGPVGGAHGGGVDLEVSAASEVDDQVRTLPVLLAGDVGDAVGVGEHLDYGCGPEHLAAGLEVDPPALPQGPWGTAQEDVGDLPGPLFLLTRAHRVEDVVADLVAPVCCVGVRRGSHDLDSIRY